MHDATDEEVTDSVHGAEMELPRYKCHKEVHALKIGAAEVNEDGSVNIQPKDERFMSFVTDAEFGKRFRGTSEDPGYYVVYEDGFKSWSPTKAFEDGYTRI